MNIEQKLIDMGLQLPVKKAKDAPFAAFSTVGNLIFLSGQTPSVDGSMAYKGIVGADVSIEQAKESAVVCTLNLLAALKQATGDLAKVKRVVKLNGYVASSPDFTKHPEVINASSELLNRLFDEAPKHARAAIGVSSLPGGAPVEIEMIVEISE
ncbi:putative endoribonuclease L-PSP [Chlamydia abortus]|uniref:RidA family protein n=1 Tax=Paenibacillus residui TaxID=629724 RepID=A0ABW3DFG9_9BACL|nr:MULTISPECIES: RidA family protein [Paenibacillaceae]SHE14574.1 putative endoribonuclease L-PSP [Chlamydia abortus]